MCGLQPTAAAIISHTSAAIKMCGFQEAALAGFAGQGTGPGDGPGRGGPTSVVPDRGELDGALGFRLAFVSRVGA